MRTRYLAPLILAAALAGCATTATEDLPTLQRRAVAAIQTAQQATTQALASGTITLQQDRDTQARLVAARAAVLAATTPAAVTAAASSVGVTP